MHRIDGGGGGDDDDDDDDDNNNNNNNRVLMLGQLDRVASFSGSPKCLRWEAKILSRKYGCQKIHCDGRQYQLLK